MAIQALGHLGIGTQDIDEDAERFFGWDRPRLADSPFAPARFLASRRSAGRCVL